MFTTMIHISPASSPDAMSSHALSFPSSSIFLTLKCRGFAPGKVSHRITCNDLTGVGWALWDQLSDVLEGLIPLWRLERRDMKSAAGGAVGRLTADWWRSPIAFFANRVSRRERGEGRKKSPSLARAEVHGASPTIRSLSEKTAKF
jgi:hypothetical protein